MKTLPTVLLHHATPNGSHHDWLIGDPTATDRDARLWTARVRLPSRAWATAGRLTLTQLSPHRRVYLERQGPIGLGRGTVRRVDAGSVIARLWTPSRRVLDVRMGCFAGQVELRRLTSERWLGQVRGEQSRCGSR